MLNVSSNVFVLASGVGAASSVLMGIAKGKKSVLEMKIVGYTGLAFNLVLMLLCAALFWCCPRLVTSAYTTDPELIEMTVPLIAACAWLSLFDGTQQVMVNILRGAMDIMVPTVCQAAAFIVIMLPLIGIMAFQLKQGVLGMTWAMVIACAFSAVFLIGRFVAICRRYDEDGFF